MIPVLLRLVLALIFGFALADLNRLAFPDEDGFGSMLHWQPLAISLAFSVMLFLATMNER